MQYLCRGGIRSGRCIDLLTHTMTAPTGFNCGPRTCIVSTLPLHSLHCLVLFAFTFCMSDVQRLQYHVLVPRPIYFWVVVNRKFQLEWCRSRRSAFLNPHRSPVDIPMFLPALAEHDHLQCISCKPRGLPHPSRGGTHSRSQ